MISPVLDAIPVKFEQFPPGYINDINGWAFDRETIEKNAGKLLTLDIDFGSRCSLNCPYCFRRGNSVDNVLRTLDYDDLVSLLKEAKELGLRSVKFLGAGEPFEAPMFLEFLRVCRNLDIIPLIFTRGHVIGDDDEVSELYGQYGIRTGEQLVEEVRKCNASIMLGFNSFHDEVQKKMVGNGSDFIVKRDRALTLLVDAGFNKVTPRATRLALAVNPIIRWNLPDAFELYKWARSRNIYAIITPPMISGRARADGWERYMPSEAELVELYTRIYHFNIQTGLQSIQQISEEGISAYAGGHPCNQVACGLYVTLNGIVLSCPGDESNVEGNIWDHTLAYIWKHSSNRKRGGTFNCKCIAKDGKTIPTQLYDSVYSRLAT